MTVGELKEAIEDLERMEGEKVLDMEVYAVYDYGDHCHTRALVDFREAEVRVPYETAYSDTGKAVKMYPEDDEEGTEAVVLS